MPFCNRNKPYVRWDVRHAKPVLPKRPIGRPPKNSPPVKPSPRTPRHYEPAGKCGQCGADLEIVLAHLKPHDRVRRKYCNLSCWGKTQVKNQLKWEQDMAKKMEDEDGWTIIRPMSCCDRIGIKDGKVYFIEFKPKHDKSLRKYQAMVRDLVPRMYKVVAG